MDILSPNQATPMPTSIELKLPIQHHRDKQERRTALLIDDKRQNQDSLRAILEGEGYQVVEANSHQEAAQQFSLAKPDIVFIDVKMSESDNHSTACRLLDNSLPQFIPVFFLSTQADENAYSRCIELGGHDYLTKPVSPTLLKAKLRSVERVRQIHSDAMRLYGQMRMDQEMAETVFDGAVIAGNVKLDCLQTIIKPAEQFNGDVLLSAYAPSNDLHILLGDFTGHGLAAALGALPAAEVFRAMTAKGFSPHQIIAGINQKLHTLLPTGMFFAVQFIAINHNLDFVKVINCGMPDVLLIDGTSCSIKQRFNSQSFPLGIKPDVEYQELFVREKITPGDRILLVSDGVTEARNGNNEYFGKERLESAIENQQEGDSILDRVLNGLTAFCQDAPQDDDISLAEVPCIPDILPAWQEKDKAAPPHPTHAELPNVESISDEPWEFTLTLPGSRLSSADPIPLLLNHIQEMEGLRKHRRLLFTLLSELYVNALDHGLLKLDSSIKHASDGFSAYFSQREQRLQNLHTGYIKICISTYSTAQGGKMKIRVEDSGAGFDLSIIDAYRQPQLKEPSGRGVQLIYSLCESVQYEEPGNCVEVVFSWDH
ncbi:ATP-binding SpoIIE family protein phosphatase [Sedimenticola sp.]|uniref:ATP-binding SpoIIE family protein phosphatase n=1 Tax=Sedimenticola sp. TaxID=1940285 RepID=UPI003D0BD50E